MDAVDRQTDTVGGWTDLADGRTDLADRQGTVNDTRFCPKELLWEMAPWTIGLVLDIADLT